MSPEPDKAPERSPLGIEDVEPISAERAEEIVARYDPSVRYRGYVGLMAIIAVALPVIWSIFQVYAAGLGTFDAIIIRAYHVSFALSLTFILLPAFGAKRKGLRFPPWYDVILAALGAMVGGYVIVNYEQLVLRAGAYTTIDLVMGGIAIVLLVEAARRVVGPVLPAICVGFLLYAYFGNYVPGLMGHRGYDLERIISHMYLTTEGIYGIAAGVSATFVFLFILFGSFLNKTGAGQLFIDLAMALMGRQSGGPAKVAVVASGLMGTINGSSVANVCGTGVFTIPMMKSIGYKPNFAGAVEAAASTGGQLMPPVMGAGAFIMSEIIGQPYLMIIAAAALPAVLYYLGVLTNVHLEAKKNGLEGLPAERLPKAGRLLRQRGHLLLPIIVVIYFLLQGFTPSFSALVGIGAAIVASALRKETRMRPRDYVDALADGARSAMPVAIATAIIGFIMGTATLTGAGLKIATAVVTLSGGNLLLTLFFTMLASLILGMGLPTTANYLVTSTIAAPALVQLGVPMLPAHLFVFYFGIIADVTPPVALAAMAGAGIANGEPTRTGLNAFRLAAAAYLVPYIFVLSPALLVINTPVLEVLRVVPTAVIGILALGSGLTGYLVTNMRRTERFLSILGAVLLIDPAITTDIIGVVCVVLVAVAQMWQRRTRRALAIP